MTGPQATTGKPEKIAILVVEDDKFLQKILLMKLAAESHMATGADNGEEALQQLLVKKPDLVVLDLILPKMNGFEVLSEMKTNPTLKDIPVVILSNLGQAEDVQRAKELGAIDFMVKSDLSIQEVVHRIVEAYAKHITKEG